MEIRLPKMTEGDNEEFLSSDFRRVTIVGANGAGKTRFAEMMMSDLDPQKVYKMSALNALYRQGDVDKFPMSIDSQYSKILSNSSYLRDDAFTQFDRLMALLIHEEIINLVAYKISFAGKTPSKELPETTLDVVTKHWQEVFPENQVLHQQGKLLFSRSTDPDTYSSVKLSEGEKAVFYYIGAVMLAPENAVIFIDNPAEFLHPSIQRVVWDKIESLRPDCVYIYTTHDLDFTTSRTENATIWVRSYDPANVTWDYAILPPHSHFSDEIYVSILGARKPVLFIEGDEIHSIDSKLYPLIFTRFTVKSLGSCDKVIEAVRSFNNLQSFHHTDSYGIIDRDRRNDEEVASLRKRKILIADVAEIENILMLEDVVKAVARHNRRNPKKAFENVKEKILELFEQEMENQAIEHTRHRIKRTTQMIIDHKAKDIKDIESYLANLPSILQATKVYNVLYSTFKDYLRKGDYNSILKVFNYKQMISQSNVAFATGVNTKTYSRPRDRYISQVIGILKKDPVEAQTIRKAVERSFGIIGDL